MTREDYEMNTSDNDDGIEIQAQLGEMFNNYEALSYQLHDALAELVDNSFDSFIKNEQALRDVGKDFEVSITVNNSKRTLVVTDNAYGMDKEELKLALIPDRKNPDPNHLGMYGRGLKTACGWFGKYWTITTKKLGSDEEYTATVDIIDLLTGSKNFIPIKTKKVPGKPTQSYTKITVRKGTRQYFAATQKQAKEVLSIKYQRFLESKINIIWVGASTKEQLTYEEPNILKLKNPEYNADEASIDEEYDEPETILYDFPCEFQILDSEGKIKATLSGRYGVYPPQDTQTRHAGLIMFWRNRVIIDRTRGYWPETVFGKAAGDLKRQRIFIHLDTEMKPTSDKKDFKWDDFSFDELDKALGGLHGGNLVAIAKIGKDLRTAKDKELTSAEIQAELQRLKKLLESQATTDALLASHPILQSGVIELTEEEEQRLDDEDSPSIDIQINQGTPKLTIKPSYNMHASDDFWKIRIKPAELKIKIYVNTNHLFYQKYCSTSSEANALFLKMISALALARWSANSSTEDVDPDSYLRLLNEYLEAAANED